MNSARIDTAINTPRAQAILIFVIIVGYAAIFQRFYFSNSFVPTHDFNVSFVSGHIVTNYLVNGFFPLWAPEQNCGFPVWADVEVFPGFDPISLLVNFAFTRGAANSISAHVVTMFFWHLCFALGGWLLFRKSFRLTPAASIFGFTLLLFSSLTVLNFRQSDDYITVYKYVPFLAYAAGRFCQQASLRNSALLGLTAGLNVCGYQAPNVAILVLFGLLAAIPYFRTRASFNYKRLLPAAMIATLMSLPAFVAAFFWITNEVVARKYFQLGYRGGFGDIIGPLAKYYPDETAIYIGMLPFLMVIAWFFKAIRGSLEERAEGVAYWPDGFMLLFAAFTWVMHIGFPENFTGVDKPFLQMRSFNDMLPYVLFSLVFFAARQFEVLEGAVRARAGEPPARWGLRERPFLVILYLVVCGTIFVELSRPSIFSLAFNRYTADPKPEGGLISELFISHFSGWHWGYFLLFCLLLLALIVAKARRSWPLFAGSLLALVILDLALMNTKLLTKSNLYAWPNDQHELVPSLTAPMPEAPPEHREAELQIDNNEGGETYAVRTPWFKEGNILYHRYTASTDVSYVWFRTHDYEQFKSSLASRQVFDNLTGVTGPLLYYATRLVKVDSEALFPTLNRQFAAGPVQAAIVVDRGGLSGQYPDDTGGGAPPAGRPEVLQFTPNSIKIKTELERPAYLVYLDSYAPEWQALIDGQGTEIIKANYLFKSVYVPAGSHVVEFSYRPYRYLLASWGRLLGWGLGLALLLFGPRLEKSATRRGQGCGQTASPSTGPGSDEEGGAGPQHGA